MKRIDEALGGVNERASRAFLDWTRPELDGWKPPVEVPPGLRFGGFAVDLKQFPSGVPVNPRLKSVPMHFDLPALIPFPILSLGAHPAPPTPARTRRSPCSRR